MVCLTPLRIGHIFPQPNTYLHIAQCVSLALVLVWGVPDLLGDGGIQRQMLSPGSLQGWGSSGKRAGAGVERWWREMDHSV